MPIEKNSTSLENARAISAAEGTSTIIPTETSVPRGIPSSSSSSATSARSIFAWRISMTVEISGNMTFTGPLVAARRIARSCVLNSFRWRSE